MEFSSFVLRAFLCRAWVWDRLFAGREGRKEELSGFGYSVCRSVLFFIRVF